jgi:hypothetical protein
LASMTHRVARRLAGGCALFLGVSLSGCAASPYTDVSAADTNIHFKIPRSWHLISRPSLVSAMKAEDVGDSGA